MEDNTNWTPFANDNLRGLIDKNLINQYETSGIGMAEIFIFELDIKTPISTTLILDIHSVAFENYMIGQGNGALRK